MVDGGIEIGERGMLPQLEVALELQSEYEGVARRQGIGLPAQCAAQPRSDPAGVKSMERWLFVAAVVWPERPQQGVGGSELQFTRDQRPQPGVVPW